MQKVLRYCYSTKNNKTYESIEDAIASCKVGDVITSGYKVVEVEEPKAKGQEDK